MTLFRLFPLFFGAHQNAHLGINLGSGDTKFGMGAPTPVHTVYIEHCPLEKGYPKHCVCERPQVLGMFSAPSKTGGKSVNLQAFAQYEPRMAHFFGHTYLFLSVDMSHIYIHTYAYILYGYTYILLVTTPYILRENSVF